MPEVAMARRVRKGKRLARRDGVRRTARRKKARDSARRYTKGVNLRSLAVEAVLLCKDMEAEKVLQLLREVKEYRLKLEMCEEDVKEVLAGRLPEWYVPSVLYLALKGDRSNGRKPLKMPLPAPELAEALGEMASDVGNSSALYTTEWEHAIKFSELMTAVTGIKHEPRKLKEKKLREGKTCTIWRIGTSSALHYLLHTGLHKVIALRQPSEFLRGLFDGDGCITAGIYDGEFYFELKSSLNKDEEDLVEFVEDLMKRKYGIKMAIKREGKTVVLYSRNEFVIRKFAKEIGFRLSRKQRRLERLLSILELRGKARVGEFIKIREEWYEDYRFRGENENPKIGSRGCSGALHGLSIRDHRE